MQTVVALRQGDVEDANIVSERLIGHVLGVTRTKMLMRWSDEMDDDARARLRPLLERRIAGEPLEYIIGECHFLGRSFAVDGAVLIPRPETEQLVQWTIQLCAQRASQWGHPGHIIDLGTGSGIIAISSALALPDWQVTAIDRSPEALRVARANAQRHDAAHRVTCAEGDWLMPLAQCMPIANAVVVSNPPYVPTAVIDTLQWEVRHHEPHGALDGGYDGLQAIRDIIDQIRHFDWTPTVFVCEVGHDQAGEVVRMLQHEHRWTEVAAHPDFAGVDRYVIAQVGVFG